MPVKETKSQWQTNLLGIATLSHVILFWANNNVAQHKKENEKINLIKRIVGEFKKNALEIIILYS